LLCSAGFSGSGSAFVFFVREFKNTLDKIENTITTNGALVGRNVLEMLRPKNEAYRNLKLSTTIAAASKNAITEFITAATVLNLYVVLSGITAQTIETTARTIITNAKNETISDVSAISNEPKFPKPENKNLKLENKSEISKSVYILCAPELVKTLTQPEQTAIKTITFITADTIFEIEFAFFTINYPFFIRYIHYIPKFRYKFYI